MYSRSPNAGSTAQHIGFRNKTTNQSLYGTQASKDGSDSLTTGDTKGTAPSVKAAVQSKPNIKTTGRLERLENSLDPDSWDNIITEMRIQHY